jgi:hypothetical protein
MGRFGKKHLNRRDRQPGRQIGEFRTGRKKEETVMFEAE